MPVLRSQVSPQSAEFKANAAHHQKLADQLQKNLETAAQGGGAETRQKHQSRGKLLARDRVAKLLDPGTSFLELSPLAAWEHYEGAAPGAGLVTGVGVMHGREVMIIANDATVKGGTYFPL